MKVKKIGIISLSVAIAIITIGIIVYQFVRNKANAGLEIIQLEEFQNLVRVPESMDEILVYIGRDSCPECTTIYPTICAIKEQNNLSMVYYSTEPDRNTRPDEMNAFLETISVDSVPTVVVISNGDVQEVYEGKDFVEAYT